MICATGKQVIILGIFAACVWVVNPISGAPLGVEQFQEIAVRFPGKVDFSIKEADIAKAVEALRKQINIPVCFESEALDSKTQGVTARQRYSELLAKKSTLDATGLSYLKILENVSAKYPDSNVGWNLPRKSLTIQKASVDAIIAQVAGAYKNYIFNSDNGFLIVSPANDSILRTQLHSISVKNSSPGAILESIEGELTKHNISFGRFGPSPVGSQDPLDLPIKTLALENPTLLELLIRISQSTEPPLMWDIVGVKGARILGFHTFNDFEP